MYILKVNYRKPGAKKIVYPKGLVGSLIERKPDGKLKLFMSPQRPFAEKFFILDDVPRWVLSVWHARSL